MKKIINCETGEVVKRELSKDELTQQAIDEVNSLAEKSAQAAEAQAKAEAKAAAQAKLAALGLTLEDLQALGL